MSHRSLVERLRSAGCVFAEDEARLLRENDPSPAELEARTLRRIAGEPLEHVLGWVEFCGLRVQLDPGVFIPRRRSEFLVRQAAMRSPRDRPVLDLCCGSGALGLALVRLAGDRELHAADLDPAAVHCARRNLEPVGGRTYTGDLFAALPDSLRGRVAVLVANVPYVPSGALDAMPAEARDHEPRTTHDGGPDGLGVLRRLLAEAPPWLEAGGHVLVEIHHGQSDAARAAFTAAGFAWQLARSDDLDATVAIGRLS